MTERKRLIELLKKADNSAASRCITNYEDAIADNADYLLASGVIVPPCKVGDTVFEIVQSYGYVREVKVVGFHLGKFTTLRGHKRKEYLVCYSNGYLSHIRIDEIGKTVFLSREEAEKALAERSKK